MNKPIIALNDMEIKGLFKTSLTLPGRMRALTRFITLSFARQFLDDVVKAAPRDVEVGNYADKLAIAQVDGRPDGSYAVGYEGHAEAENVKDLDAATTIFYVRKLKRKARDYAKIATILGKYGPFAMGHVPTEINDKKVRIVYRQVSENEVKAVARRNKLRERKLRMELIKAGAKVAPHKVDPDNKIDFKEMKAYSEFAFKVLRKEFGIRTKAKPHWRPAVAKVKNKKTMGQILSDDVVKRTTTDHKYTGWRTLGHLNKRMSKEEAAGFDAFQKKILGG